MGMGVGANPLTYRLDRAGHLAVLQQPILIGEQCGLQDQFHHDFDRGQAQ